MELPDASTSTLSLPPVTEKLLKSSGLRPWKLGFRCQESLLPHLFADLGRKMLLFDDNHANAPAQPSQPVTVTPSKNRLEYPLVKPGPKKKKPRICFFMMSTNTRPTVPQKHTFAARHACAPAQPGGPSPVERPILTLLPDW